MPKCIEQVLMKQLCIESFCLCLFPPPSGILCFLLGWLRPDDLSLFSSEALKAHYIFIFLSSTAAPMALFGLMMLSAV